MKNKHPLPRRIKIALGMLAAGVLLTLLAPKIPLVSSPADAPVPERWQGEVVRFTAAHVDHSITSDAVVTIDDQSRLSVSADGRTMTYALTDTTLTARDMYRILQFEKRICLEVTGNQEALPVVRLLVTDPLLRAAGKASPSLLQPCSADITEFVPKTEVKRDASA
ncbi:hypothetical protein [Serratia marcescens]|uniref:hypothetical protein n=1 Tax=Serratia marcescens TaxID=615 RepID=UPI0024A74B4C|nr:hypothetical protein [Serratia marcescens]